MEERGLEVAHRSPELCELKNKASTPPILGLWCWNHTQPWDTRHEWR